MTERLDVMIFGASGYTGKRVVESFYDIVTNENLSVTCGIAGRSLHKLNTVLEELSNRTGKKLYNVVLVQADTENENSLLEMASRARILINCTGPYKYHGEAVVRACIKKSCHYVDVAAESLFTESLQLIYNEEAARLGVYIVPECGFHNVLHDIGLEFLKKNFKGTLNSVECYTEVISYKGSKLPTVINLTSWETMIHSIVDIKDLKKVRIKLHKKKLPELLPKLSVRYLPHKIPLSKQLAIQYPEDAIPQLTRSQRIFYELDRIRPIQVQTYIGFASIWHFVATTSVFLIAFFLSKFHFGLRLLLKYPKLFTLGLFCDQPSLDATKDLQTIVTLHGRGWKGKVVDDRFQEKEDRRIIAKVTGYDPYGITGICAAACAITLLREEENLPKKGGVYTSAPCFTKTTLIDLLQRNGISFELSEAGDI